MPGLIYGRIMDVLNGKAEPESLGPTWRHTMSWHSYKEAERILAIKFVWRKDELAKLSPRFRELVEAEMIRLHRLRNLGKRRPIAAAPIPKPHWHGWKK